MERARAALLGHPVPNMFVNDTLKLEFSRRKLVEYAMVGFAVCILVLQILRTKRTFTVERALQCITSGIIVYILHKISSTSGFGFVTTILLSSLISILVDVAWSRMN